MVDKLLQERDELKAELELWKKAQHKQANEARKQSDIACDYANETMKLRDENERLKKELERLNHQMEDPSEG